uniref:Secreted protein n=1 Tax=Odontella aurita TaxID=265563 RepID=A0A7S4N7T3_9STRA|mmetsp:Transcript_51300/g.154158  ORF Transcript_51300/g.154158 Transcript_51300/m.154158 type:complete len:101 (+) Transcript_51300:157-459(+)
MLVIIALWICIASCIGHGIFSFTCIDYESIWTMTTYNIIAHNLHVSPHTHHIHIRSRLPVLTERMLLTNIRSHGNIRVMLPAASLSSSFPSALLPVTSFH